MFIILTFPQSVIMTVGLPHVIAFGIAKMMASAGFSAKGRCAVDKMHEIYAVFQSNAARICGNSADNASFSPGLSFMELIIIYNVQGFPLSH